jgi:PHD/YefM family antitoxin component YafN of YafNO toxin-antitoxin module
MREREQPITQTMNISDARAQLGQVATKVYHQETRVVLEKGGIPVAAIVSPQDFALFQRLEAERDRDFAVLFEIGEKFKDVPLEELEREVAKAVAEVREENRQRRERTSNTG